MQTRYEKLAIRVERERTMGFGPDVSIIEERLATSYPGLSRPRALCEFVGRQAQHAARGLVKSEPLAEAAQKLLAARCEALLAQGVDRRLLAYDAKMSFLLELPVLAKDLETIGLLVDGPGTLAQRQAEVYARVQAEFPDFVAQPEEQVAFTAALPEALLLLSAGTPRAVVDLLFAHFVSRTAQYNTTRAVRELFKVFPPEGEMIFSRPVPRTLTPHLSMLVQMAHQQPHKRDYQLACEELANPMDAEPIPEEPRDRIGVMLEAIQRPESQQAFYEEVLKARNVAILTRAVARANQQA
jgi:hypothetical protein